MIDLLSDGHQESIGIREHLVRVLLMILLVAATATVGCRHAQTKSYARRNEQPHTYSVWQAKPDLADASRRGYFVTLYPGMAIARRFQSEAAGTYLRGAFYVVEAVGGHPRAPNFFTRNWLDFRAENEIVVVISLCSDEGNHLGDICRTRLCSTQMVVPPMAMAEHGEPYRAPFAMSCKVERRGYYWLVFEPGPDWTVSGNLMGPRQGERVSMLAAPLTADTVQRNFSDVGPGLGDFTYIDLIADLDIVGRLGSEGRRCIKEQGQGTSG